MRCELNVKTREKMVDTEDIFRRLTSGAKFNRQRLNEELSFLRVSFALPYRFRNRTLRVLLLQLMYTLLFLTS